MSTREDGIPWGRLAQMPGNVMRGIGAALRGPTAERKRLAAEAERANAPAIAKAIAIDTVPTAGQPGNREWDEFQKTPFVRDTLSSVAGAFNPRVNYVTKGRPGYVSTVSGDYGNDTVRVEADFPSDVRYGYSTISDNPMVGMRRLLSHEVGHAIGQGSEKGADMTSAVIDALSATAGQADATPETIAQRALTTARQRRVARKAAGGMSGYIEDYNPADADGVLRTVRQMLNDVPVYANHPAKRR